MKYTHTDLLFDEIELLNKQIEELVLEQQILKEKRQRLQDHVELLISYAENNLNNGE